MAAPSSTCSLSNPPSYASCVSSLRTSLQFLVSSVETLDAGVSDFPRLINVLKTVRVRSPPILFLSVPCHCEADASLNGNPSLPQHYELIPQPTLAAAEASLRDEIGPSIAMLLARADAQVERQDRRIETLKARSELQHGRLTRPDEPSKQQQQQQRLDVGRHSRPFSGEDKLRARAVKQRKEALRYGVERLELEVLQKERELRKRLED